MVAVTIMPRGPSDVRLKFAPALPGPPGPPGPASTVPGPVGPAPTITGGAVATLSPGSPATASLTPGAQPGSYTLSLGIPKGDTGASGSGAGNVNSIAEARDVGDIVVYAGTGGTTIKRAGPLTPYMIPLLGSGDAKAFKINIGLRTYYPEDYGAVRGGVTGNALTDAATALANTTAFQAMAADIAARAFGCKVRIRSGDWLVLGAADPNANNRLFDWTDPAGVEIEGHGARLLSPYVGDNTVNPAWTAWDSGGQVGPAPTKYLNIIQSRFFNLVRPKDVHLHGLTLESMSGLTLDELYNIGGIRNYILSGSTDCSFEDIKVKKHTAGLSFTREADTDATNLRNKIKIAGDTTIYTVETHEGDAYDIDVKAETGYRAVIGHNITGIIHSQCRNMYFDEINLSAANLLTSHRAYLNVDIYHRNRGSSHWGGSFVDLGTFMAQNADGTPAVPVVQATINARVFLDVQGGTGADSTGNSGPGSLMAVGQTQGIPAAGHRFRVELHANFDGQVAAGGSLLNCGIAPGLGTTNVIATRANWLVDIVAPDSTGAVNVGMDDNKFLSVSARHYTPNAPLNIVALQAPTLAPSRSRIEGIFSNRSHAGGREVTTPVFRLAANGSGIQSRSDAASGVSSHAFQNNGVDKADVGYQPGVGGFLRAYGTDPFNITGNGTTFNFDNLALKMNGTQLLGVRNTGWTAMNGTPNKGPLATLSPGTVSGSYAQSEMQSLWDKVVALSQRLMAIDAALRAHGLID